MTSTITGLWKQHGGNPVENYERFFVPTIGTTWASALLETADLRAGERVLDIACGTGVVARRAAEQVGPSGSVAGLDISPGMLEIARASTAEIDWHEGDAATLPLPDGAFDVVVSSLGMQFVEDKQSAFHEMHRVLAPGGRVAIATGGGTTQPLFAVLEQALARHVSPEVAGFMRAVFSLYDPEQLRTLAADAGFDDIDVRSKVLTVTLPGPAEFLWQYVHSTPWSPRSRRSTTRGWLHWSTTSWPDGSPSSGAGSWCSTGSPSSRRRGGATGRPPSQQRHGCDSALLHSSRGNVLPTDLATDATLHRGVPEVGAESLGLGLDKARWPRRDGPSPRRP